VPGGVGAGLGVGVGVGVGAGAGVGIGVGVGVGVVGRGRGRAERATGITCVLGGRGRTAGAGRGLTAGRVSGIEREASAAGERRTFTCAWGRRRGGTASTDDSGLCVAGTASSKGRSGPSSRLGSSSNPATTASDSPPATARPQESLMISPSLTDNNCTRPIGTIRVGL
jgi:hypothetical protein